MSNGESRIRTPSGPARTISAAVCVFFASLATSEPGHAAEPVPVSPKTPVTLQSEQHRLIWSWHRFDAVDYGTTAVTLGAFLYLQYKVEPRTEPIWRGGLPLDDAVRSLLVGQTRGVRDAALHLSAPFWLLPQAIAWADVVVPTLLFDHMNTRVAWQLAMISLQSSAIAGLLARGGHVLVSRERPDNQECERNPEYGELCGVSTTAGFPGGHIAGAFLGAGLICANHLHLPLYGGGAADKVVCAAAATMAVTAGLLRITADRHYFSDTVVGATIGIGAGFILPWLRHYVSPKPPHGDDGDWAIMPLVGNDDTGIMATGRF